MPSSAMRTAPAANHVPLYKTFLLLREMLRIVSFRKILNFGVMLISYQIARMFKQSPLRHLPVSVSIEPTSACNLRCPECPTGLGILQRPKGSIHTAVFRTIIQELAPTLFTTVFYVQGEPLLHRDLGSLIAFARQRRVFTMLSTNGHLLTPAKAQELVAARLHRLIVSVDGADQATYALYRRGGDLATVLQGIRNVQAAKHLVGSPFPLVELQFLVFGTNEHQIPQMRQIARELGVRLRLKSAQIADFEQGNPLIPSISRYSRYRKLKNGRYAIKSTLGNSCRRMWAHPAITWDGRVAPCCFDKDAVFAYGQLGLMSFAEVWQSPTRKWFVEQIFTHRHRIQMCQNCTEGLKL